MALSNESMIKPPIANGPGLDRQRRIRRNVWWLAALALTFYIGFIAMSVSGVRG